MFTKFFIIWHIFVAFSSVCLDKNCFVLATEIAGFRRKLDDIAGSINIDCGIPENPGSSDAETSIQYVSDTSFASTGINKDTSTNFTSASLPKPLMSVRSFPSGTRNCYTLRPPEGKESIYLIRATFMYGNYDDLDKLPQFNLYLGVNLWDTVKFDNSSHVVTEEIIHISTMDNIYVCLVNIGLGTPFISALELRHFHNSTYKSKPGTSLVLYQHRLNFGSTSNQTIRYHDDIYDRIWFPYNFPQCATLNSSSVIDSLKSTDFNLPSKVMQNAVQPTNDSDTLRFDFDIGDPNSELYVYMHFAELETLRANQYREFNIELNGKVLRKGVVLNYLQSTTITTLEPVRGGKLNFSLYKSPNSTLPPILNAMEIYLVRDLWQNPTHQDDVNAIEEIKSSYNVDEGWQGDPCLPVVSWQGLNCSNNGYDPPRIISINLSSSALTGKISSSLSRIQFLEYLDLSNNRLSGEVPDFLSQLTNLRILNLEGNKLSGSVPLALMERSKNGSLSLRLGANPKLCLLSECKEDKRSLLIPLVATIVPLAFILTALIIIYWRHKIKKVLTKPREISDKSQNEDGLSSLKTDKRQFTYSEIVKITNNFSTIIGKGGFGTVYHGYLNDGAQVAVKMLSSTTGLASTQFLTEAHLLMRVHHRNLALFVGYCNETPNVGIIYEYMAYGNLEQYLSDKSMEALTWKERLHIALDAAQGLEYLHHGCRPPIIHRDVKTANILLNDNLQAKIADFGFSKLVPSESRSHLSTVVVGTVGYVDPEYYSSGRLTERSDVYSFGIVLLELITGQPAIIRNHDENLNIVKWATPFIEKGDIRNVVDPKLKGNFDTNSVWNLVEIAMSCVPSISIQRPNMNHIVAELKECLLAEMAHEHMEGEIISQLSNSFEVINVNLDSETGPEAR